MLDKCLLGTYFHHLVLSGRACRWQICIWLPSFRKRRTEGENGTFTIEKENSGKNNNYIQSIILNGKEYNKPWIDYNDIIKGGSLKFIMGDNQKAWY